MKVGTYEIVSTIGRGGMGTVLRARSEKGADVALKVLNPHGDAARFAREKRILESLGDSDGFVPLLDWGRCDQGPYIVMPFVPGGTLRARLERGKLAVDATIQLGRALARSLGKAHARGIVHRDMKPENVLYDARGRPLIADLGLAKHFDPDASGAKVSVSLSRDGELIGTAGYMALEQLESPRDVEPSADVFSLGAILYECLAGVPAYPGENLVEILGKLERDQREPLARLRPDAPAWLVAAVEKCLARERSRRFENAAELGRALAGPVRPPRRGKAAAAALLVAIAGTAALLRPAAREGLPRVASVPSRYEALVASKTLELTGFWGLPNGKHAGAALCVAWLPDGKRLVSGGGDSTAREWDAETGAELRVFTGHKGDVRALAVSRDGSRLVTAGGDNVIAVWNLSSGEKVRAIGPLPKYFDAVSFLPDGDRFVTCGCEAHVDIFEVATGIATDRGQTGQEEACALSVSPDGTRLLVAGRDKTLRLLEVPSLKELAKLEGHEGPVSAVAFAPDGRRAYSGSESQGVRAWDLSAPAWRWNQVQGAPVTAIAVSPAGDRIASAGDGSKVLVWNPDGKNVLSLDTGSKSAVSALAFSPDGKRLAVAVRDGSIRVFDAVAGRELWPPHGNRGSVLAAAISDDGALVATSDLDGTILLRDARSGAELRSFGIPANPAGALAFARDGKRLMAGGWDATIRIYETASGREIRDALGHGNRIVALACLADGRRFVSAARDGTLKVYELDTGKLVRSIVADSECVDALVLDSSKRFAVAGGRDGRVKRFELETGSLLETFEGTEEVRALALDERRGKLATAGWSRSLKVWSVATRTLERTIECPFEAFQTHGLAVLGGRLASARRFGPFLVHDIETGELVDEIPFAMDRDEPSALALSADGRFLVLGTERGVALRYDVRE